MTPQCLHSWNLRIFKANSALASGPDPLPRKGPQSHPRIPVPKCETVDLEALRAPGARGRDSAGLPGPWLRAGPSTLRGPPAAALRPVLCPKPPGSGLCRWCASPGAVSGRRQEGLSRGKRCHQPPLRHWLRVLPPGTPAPTSAPAPLRPRCSRGHLGYLRPRQEEVNSGSLRPSGVARPHPNRSPPAAPRRSLSFLGQQVMAADRLPTPLWAATCWPCWPPAQAPQGPLKSHLDVSSVPPGEIDLTAQHVALPRASRSAAALPLSVRPPRRSPSAPARCCPPVLAGAQRAPRGRAKVPKAPRVWLKDGVRKAL